MTVRGFFKSVLGKPTVEGTGLHGLWSRVRKTPGNISKIVTRPIGMMKFVITGILIAVGYIMYKRMR